MSLGKTLKALRQKQGLNQKGLSGLSGVSQATISRIETGRVRQLRSSALKNLADALSVSVDFLMGDNEVFAPIPQAGTHSLLAGKEDRFPQIADYLEPFAVHENGRFLYVNQSFAELVGYDREELLIHGSIERIVAPESRSLVQRLFAGGMEDTREILLVRSDQTLFPVELASRNLAGNIQLGIVRDISQRRSQQASARLEQAGLSIDSFADLGKVVRMMADELQDTGIPFEVAELHMIDEETQILTSWTAYPESKGYQLFTASDDIPGLLGDLPPVRGLLNHWRRSKVWEREVDEAFQRSLLRRAPSGPPCNLGTVIDVPMSRGSVSVGLAAGKPVRSAEVVDFLYRLTGPIDTIVGKLQQVETVRQQLQSLQATPTQKLRSA